MTSLGSDELQRLVSVGEAAAPSEAAQSETGDLACLDDLDDDAAWAKIEKGKRKAVISRQRDRLAKDVKHSLGKVSGASSPFAKR